MWPLQVRLVTEGSVCRREKRKFPAEDNGFRQAHNSFISGFTLSGHGEIEGKYQSGHIRTMPIADACQLGKHEPQL